MKVIVFVALAIAMACAQPLGIAYMRGTARDSTVRGTVIFSVNATDSNYIDVTVNLTGITQNLGANHGLHVHMWGDLSDATTGLATGPHWYIGNETHSCPPNETRHSGDMGNWFVGLDGSLVSTGTFDKLALTGVNSIIGRAVILHNLTDDCTINNGNAGARIAQGVIGYVNAANNNASNGYPRTTTGKDYAVCTIVPIGNNTEVIRGYGIASQGPTGGIEVIIVLTNVTANKVHGVHIHQFGDLRDVTAGLSLGGHWNPLNQRHGMYGYPAHHMGDLGNVAYFASGDATIAMANFTQPNASFYIIGEMYNVIGHGMVIHATRDNCSDPIGASGARYATCVWGIGSGNFSYFVPTPPTGVNSAMDAQSKADCDASFGLTTTTTTATTTGDMTTGMTTGSAATIVLSALTILAAMLL